MFSRRGAENTLDLTQDGDVFDLVDEIEECFVIKLSDAEVGQTTTMAELHHLVCAKLGPGSGVSLTDLALCRLRDGLGRPDLVRATPIAALRGGLSEPAWCRTVGRQADLDLDGTEEPRWAGWLASALTLGPLIAAVFTWSLLGPGALLWLVLWGLVWLVNWVPRRLPPEVVTVGDLIRRTMGRNHARLAATGPGNSADVWHALCGLVRDVTGHRGALTPETTLYPSPWRR